MHGSMIGIQLNYISGLVKMANWGLLKHLGPGYKIMSKVNWIFGKIALVRSQNFKHAS